MSCSYSLSYQYHKNCTEWMLTPSDQQLLHCWVSHSPTSLSMTADLSLPECPFAGSRINTMPSRQESCSPALKMCFRIWFNQDLLPQRQSFASRSVSGNTKHVFNLSAFLLCTTTSTDTQSKLHSEHFWVNVKAHSRHFESNINEQGINILNYVANKY